MFIKIFLPFISLFIATSAIAQDYKIQRLSKENIYYNGQQIPFLKAENIFEAVPKAYHEYRRAKRSINSSKVLGYTTIGLIVGGITAIAVDNVGDEYCDTICFTLGDGIGVIAIGVAEIVGTTALLINGGGIRRQRRAISYYNDHFKDQSYYEPTPELYFGVTQNGIGFYLNF